MVYVNFIPCIIISLPIYRLPFVVDYEHSLIKIMEFTKKILVVFALTIMLGISCIHCRPSSKSMPRKILFILFFF